MPFHEKSLNLVGHRLQKIAGLVFFSLWSVVGVACQSIDVPKRGFPGNGQGEFFQKGYMIGPEDVLEINVWKNPELGKVVVVRPDGMITLPLVGEVKAGGVSPMNVREVIRIRLQKYYQDIPEVTVEVSAVNSYYIYVLGEVRAPGKFQIKSYMTVLQVVALAGGFTEWAKKNKMLVLRNGAQKNAQRIQVKYKDILNESASDRVLFRGDTLIVP